MSARVATPVEMDATRWGSFVTEMEQALAKKPILTVEQQIGHLKEKGVQFELCDENEAARILAREDHYFKLASYRVLFPKRVGGPRDGQYAGLDFGHLADLAAIDQELREFLLPLTLSVENSAKTGLIGRMAETLGEDGYSVLVDYFAGLNHGDRNRRQGEIKRLGSDAYLGALVDKYSLDKMPVWVYLELASFGAFADFYLFCADRWNDGLMRREHYLLRAVNSLRNAAAHSSAILNGMRADAPKASIRVPQEVAIALEEIGINKRARRSKMRNPRILQMTVLAYAFGHFVPNEKRLRVVNSLNRLECRVLTNAGWYAGNTVVKSSYGFLSKVFDGLLC